jgi:membrane protein
MARLRDFPIAIRKVGVITFAKRVWAEMNEDNVFTWASALAYAWLFAIFPFLIFVLTLFPYLPQQFRRSADRLVHHAVHDALPAKSAETLSAEIDRVLNQPQTGLLSVGLLLALWGASGGMSMTMSALDRAYDVERARPYLKQRLTAICLTISVATLILATIVLIPIGTTVTRIGLKYVVEYAEKLHLGRWVAPVHFLWNFMRYSFGALFLVTAVALLYHFGPSLKQRWRWITPGSAFAIGGWILLGLVFRKYVDHSGSYDKTYGTVGGVVILLLCFYLNAVVLLIGAEINAEVDLIARNIQPGSKDYRGDPESTPVSPAP